VTNTDSNVNDMNIDVFPNPTSEWLNVSLGNLTDKKDVSIFQLNGAQIISEQVKGNNVTFQLSDYPSGTYVLKVKCNNKVKFVQFIKD
jgi:Secretion system C-terminal sorting domain